MPLKTFETVIKLLSQIPCFLKIIKTLLKGEFATYLVRKKKVFLFISSFILILLLFCALNTKSITQTNFYPSIYTPKIKPAKFDFTNKNTYKGLPVGEIKTFNVSRSKGSVIFIPQYHRATGSNTEDKINNAGAITQEEIYQILNFLVKKTGIEIAMVEGSLYGEVPVEKIALLADKIEKRNELARLYETLKKEFQKEEIDSSLDKKLLKSLENEIIQVDREIILEGASEKLKAEGQNIKLYGAENLKTKEEAKLVLRDFIFLQDRIDQLETVSKKTSINLYKDTSKESLLELLLKRFNGPVFKPLESQALALGKKDLAKLIRRTEIVFNELENKIPEKIMLTSSSNTPTLADNPYKNATNEEYLKERFHLAKEKMQEVVVEKRNKETAENMAYLLKSEGETTGILQFGAGHEKGLVEQLNKQGLSVIVIKSLEVVKRQESKL